MPTTEITMTLTFLQPLIVFDTFVRALHALVSRVQSERLVPRLHWSKLQFPIC